MNQNLKIKDEGIGIKGSYVIKTFRAGTKELLREQRVENLVVNGSGGYGKNILARALVGSTFVTVIPPAINNASIGTGTNAPAASDTDLQTPVEEDIPVALGEITGTSELVISFFIADANLANGTYTEFGIFCDSGASKKLFARSIISPSYEKGSSEDTSLEYTLTIS